MKRPAFQFYPGDWLHDAALRSCSIEARGLWMDMMCIMHQAEPYGYLMVNLKVINEDNLARLVGVPRKRLKSLLFELENAGVFSKNIENSALFCRRMVRDEEVRNRRAQGGSLGGNPALLKHKKHAPKDNPKDNDKVNLATKSCITPSSSSSSSYSYIRASDQSDADEKNEENPAENPAKKRQTHRERNPLFDSLAKVGGSNVLELTTSAARAVGVALAEIRRATPDVTTEEIARRANTFRSRNPTWKLTPNSLARHWAECGSTFTTPQEQMDLPDNVKELIAIQNAHQSHA